VIISKNSKLSRDLAAVLNTVGAQAKPAGPAERCCASSSHASYEEARPQLPRRALTSCLTRSFHDCRRSLATKFRVTSMACRASLPTDRELRLRALKSRQTRSRSTRPSQYTKTECRTCHSPVPLVVAYAIGSRPQWSVLNPTRGATRRRGIAACTIRALDDVGARIAETGSEGGK
jgi:hypothetical protein